MEEKKTPRIPAWKVWILIITTMQVISAVQNYCVHQEMWDGIHKTDYLLTQKIQLDIVYFQNMIQLEDQQTNLLKEQKEALERQKEALDEQKEALERQKQALNEQKQALEQKNQLLKEYCK